MNHITSAQIKTAIQAFLQAQYDKKTEKEQKQREKAVATNQFEEAEKLQTYLDEMKEKYHPANWLREAQKMAQHVQVGTHVSRGNHPSSRGDNVRFQRAVTHDYVGTHTVQSVLLDANSPRGAIDLPVVSFFEWQVSETVKMRDLIAAHHSALTGCFDDDLAVSNAIQQTFFDCLNNQFTQANTHERNKQILWAIHEHEQYHTLVPLHPSVLTHEFYHRINQLRYSEENKTARENRYKKTAEQQTYISIVDLAAVQLGGTKPQNVSQLVNKQGGRHYLLPSLPPSFSASEDLSISKQARSIFDTKSLNYQSKAILQALFQIIETQYNNVHIREARKAILDDLLCHILGMAMRIQEHRPAGWSREYDLNLAEKYWLDPKRAELVGEEDFKAGREQTDWRSDIERYFANWLQNLLKQQFQEIAQHFGDSEYLEWRKEMEAAIKDSQLLGQGVFA